MTKLKCWSAVEGYSFVSLFFFFFVSVCGFTHNLCTTSTCLHMLNLHAGYANREHLLCLIWMLWGCGHHMYMPEAKVRAGLDSMRQGKHNIPFFYCYILFGDGCVSFSYCSLCAFSGAG